MDEFKALIILFVCLIVGVGVIWAINAPIWEKCKSNTPNGMNLTGLYLYRGHYGCEYESNKTSEFKKECYRYEDSEYHGEVLTKEEC